MDISFNVVQNLYPHRPSPPLFCSPDHPSIYILAFLAVPVPLGGRCGYIFQCSAKLISTPTSSPPFCSPVIFLSGNSLHWVPKISGIFRHILAWCGYKYSYIEELISTPGVSRCIACVSRCLEWPCGYKFFPFFS